MTTCVLIVDDRPTNLRIYAQFVTLMGERYSAVTYADPAARQPGRFDGGRLSDAANERRGIYPKSPDDARYKRGAGNRHHRASRP